VSGYNRIPWNLVVIFLILSVGICAVGYSTYDYQIEQIKISRQEELSAISDLKVSEITRWYQEVVDDGKSLSKNEHFMSNVEQLSENPENNEFRSDITIWMKAILENRQYNNVILVDPSGNTLISFPDGTPDIDDHTKPLVKDALATNEIILSDFYRIDENEDFTQFKMLIPLTSQDSSVGVLVIRIDHAVVLDKIITSWPTPSESSESLIVRREGDNVIFLNELRHQKNTILSLSMPINQIDLPAAMAVSGREGIVEGVDYRGVKVLASIRAIPDTPWFMIAKVDIDEIYAPIKVRATYLIFIVGILIIFSAVSIGFFWQHQNTQLLNSEKKSQYTRDLIETSLDMLMTISPDGKITEANKATELATGISRNQLIGTNFSDYFTEPDLAKEGYQTVLDEGVVEDAQLVIRHVSGDTLNVIFNGTTYLDKDGNIKSIFAAGRDITELKHIENALKKSHDELEIRVKERTADLLDANIQIQQMNIDLEQKVAERTSELTAVNKELEAFSYSVSHDLRAPLRSVDGFSQALLEDYGDKFDETGTDYLHRVRNATQNMAQLIDDLLSLSRITRGEVVSKELDLSDLVLDIAEKYKMEEPERQMDFVIAEKVKANGDERLLRAMLENLISNACKFTSNEPITKIEFGITRINDEDAYFIRDNGVGFDMAYADKLFGAFQRLHSKAEFPGTGIGLATVQRIIHKHGGRIWAESELGKGATFYFTI